MPRHEESFDTFLCSTTRKQAFIVLTYRKCWHVANPKYSQGHPHPFHDLTLLLLLILPSLLSLSCHRSVFVGKL